MSREFVMLVGLPGSGKSTQAKKYESLGFKVFSSDDYRKKLNLASGKTPKSLFPMILKDMKEALTEGHSVVFDATNLNSKKRRNTLREIGLVKYPIMKTVLMVLAPFEVCLKRNSLREGVKKVPLNKMIRFYRGWQTPHKGEGYDRLLTVKTSDRSLNKYKELSKTLFFNQENHYHNHSLFGHLARTRFYNRKESKEIRVASLFHDIGKVKTKTFFNCKGERTIGAHYYGHENVGAYDSLFYNFKDIDVTELSTLICYHMRPYATKEEKGIRTFGKELWLKLKKIHEADSNSH